MKSKLYMTVGGLLAMIVLPGCRDEPEAKEHVRPVRAMRIADAEGFSRSGFTGRAKATQEVNIAFEVPGKLNERPVDVGNEVKIGQLLARLDPRDFQNSLDATVARRDQAEAYRGRIAEAAKSGAVSQQQLTDAEARLEVTEAEVKIAEKALEDTEIRAPFEGVIVATYVENFQNVRAKQPVVRLLDITKIEMWVDIPEQLISLAPHVKEIVVTFDAFPDRPIPARIKEIGTEASERTRTFPVNLIMDQPEGVQVLPGMAGTSRGRVEVPGGDGEYEVPMSAVFTDDSAKKYVWLIDEGAMTVAKQEVTPGWMTSHGMLVDGLEPGQWIATAGVHFLKPGQKVRILDEAALFAGARGESP